MDAEAFLRGLMADPAYRGQITHVRVEQARPARYARPQASIDSRVSAWLGYRGARSLYTHQAQAVDALENGQDVVVATGTSSGKSLCYLVPMLQMLLREGRSTALLLFPTKALCQDQLAVVTQALDHVGLGARAVCGVYDGDTPPDQRRRLRDQARVILSNPDMLHASVLGGHSKWSRFLSALGLVVVDELHVHTGVIGTNVALLMRRLDLVLDHYGARPRLVACSATTANPAEHARAVTGRPCEVVDDDGSPRGKRTWVLWNPPRELGRPRRSRRPANDEAASIMARLVGQGTATITFSKARVTAEMIHRYVAELLRAVRPGLEHRVAPYRGGYLPEQRRDLEARLRSGDLLGVSATSALELGIDVGSLEACVIVGYPGTVSSLRQQAGRAGRLGRESLVVLVGLDTAVNQYVLRHPEYLFDHVVEQAVVDVSNPFALTDHLWCAIHELPMSPGQVAAWGPRAEVSLEALAAAGKITHRDGRYYHCIPDDPHHDVSLRTGAERNVVIRDAVRGAALGEVGIRESLTLVYPGAVYLHQGETYRVLDLDLERGEAKVSWEQTDYYTHPEGGTDVHHVDRILRTRPLGTGKAYWGEVTAHLWIEYYETVSFHSLDTVSKHGVVLPRLALETTACWVVPPESLMRSMVEQGMDPQAGLRGVGYALRMLLPLHLICDTYDFSQSVGCVNAPWNALFVYERFPHGLGFTLSLYRRLGQVLAAVRSCIQECDCVEGCPRCTGKPLRGYATWNVERGEACIPSKRAALAVLDGLLQGPPNAEDDQVSTDGEEAARLHLLQSLARRLDRNRDPRLIFAAEGRVEPVPPEGYPAASVATLRVADSEIRRRRHLEIARALRRREQAARTPPPASPLAAPPKDGSPSPAARGVPTDTSSAPPARMTKTATVPSADPPSAGGTSIAAIASRARRLRRERDTS